MINGDVTDSFQGRLFYYNIKAPLHNNKYTKTGALNSAPSFNLIVDMS